MSRNPAPFSRADASYASALRLFQTRRHVPGGHGWAKQDCLQALSGKLATESKFFWQNLDGRAAFGYKNPRPNVFLFKRAFPGRQGRTGRACPAAPRSGLDVSGSIRRSRALTFAGVAKCRKMSSRSSPKTDPTARPQGRRVTRGCKVGGKTPFGDPAGPPRRRILAAAWPGLRRGASHG